MSIMTQQMSIMSMRPSIHEDGEAVTISTGWLTSLLTLFLRKRRTKIVPVLRKVFMSCRTAYFFKSRETVDFADISHVDYSFTSVGTDYGVTDSGFGRHDQFEHFAISIVTKDRNRHFVCSFKGDGATCTGWTGVLLGNDSYIDVAGTQESESRLFAKYLADILGVTIGTPVEAMADMTQCPACDRSVSPYKAKCIYCGATVNT